MTPALTPTERRTLNAIMAHVLAFGFPPSIRELCKLRSRRSTNSSAEMLTKLERKGYVQLPRHPGRARSITILRDVDGMPVHLSFRRYETIENTP